MKNLIYFSLTILILGCAVTGTTRKVVVKTDVPISDQSSRIKSVVFDYDKSKMELQAVGAYSWGKFSQKDAENLQSSLNESINTFNGENTEIPQLRLIMVMRNYTLAASNNSMAILTCIAWALLDEKNPIYEEQFYAANSFFSIPLGWGKNRINKNIIQRITSVTKCIVSDRINEIRDIKTDNIYLNFDEAKKNVPKGLTSSYSGNGYYAWLRGGLSWNNEEKNKIIWKEYISK